MDKLISIYVDCLRGQAEIKIDDFIIAIGQTKSNSVYHVAQVQSKPSPKNPKMIRHYLKCYRSDLLTALLRDPDQKLYPMTWYKREKNYE